MAKAYSKKNEPIITLVASLALNGVDITLKEPQREGLFRPDVNLDGRVNIEILDILIKHAYGIED